MMFFQSELGWSVLNCSAGPLILSVGLLYKNKKQKESAGARSLPLRCLSQFFPGEEKINFLRNEFSMRKSTYLSLVGWPGIYNG